MNAPKMGAFTNRGIWYCSLRQRLTRAKHPKLLPDLRSHSCLTLCHAQRFN